MDFAGEVVWSRSMISGNKLRGIAGEGISRSTSITLKEVVWTVGEACCDTFSQGIMLIKHGQLWMPIDKGQNVQSLSSLE